MKRRTRIWTGLGASFLLGTSTAALAAGAPDGYSAMDDGRAYHAHSLAAAQLAQAHGHGPAAAPPAAAGGEGGEGGEGGALSGLDPDADFAVRLLMMRGHLRAGADLFHAGDRQNGAMHFAHPLSEVYEDLAPLLARRGVAPFRDTLQRVVDRTTAGASADEVDRLRAEAESVIDAAIARVAPAGKRPNELVVAAAIALLRTAAHEYGESIKDGKFTDVEEYQDARGFVLVVRDWILASEAPFKARNADAYATVTRQMADLVSALSPPVPPPQPVRSVAQLLGEIARIEFALNNLK